MPARAAHEAALPLAPVLRRLLAAGALLMSATAGATARLDLEQASVEQLQAEMEAGALSAQALVQYYQKRIAERDPQLHAVIELNPDALRIAQELDRERATDGSRGPLHGIPVLLKDNIDTADAMLTTAGSFALMGTRPSQDAFVVELLRDAGAVILGKTNLSEWANFRSTRSSSGWSARGGQTRNPHGSERSPCGSSSGSAVAVAAGFAPLAVGTETDGSIVCPASITGIVGIKPTLGLVSRSGIIPIAASQDTAGPMARSVADAALLLEAMIANDEADPATAPLATMRLSSLQDALRPDGLRGARIGVLRDLAGFHEGVDAVFAQALGRMGAQGAEIVDDLKLDLPQSIDDDELTVLLYEFKDGIGRYLSSRPPGGPRSLADLIAFNEQNAVREMAWFGQELFLKAQQKGPLTDAAYRQAAQRARVAARRAIDALMDAHRLDALVAPTSGPAWTIDLVNGDHFSGGNASQPAAVAGYPHVTVPAGEVHGLPVGLSFIGRAWTEGNLVRLAYGYERASQPPRQPLRGAPAR